jgi:predicted dehydrogenase
MVGYNRRFSPGVQRCRAVLAGRTTPMIVNYRMNAGYLPPLHWTQGPEGGGRNLGEACHIYDLFNALVDGAGVASVHAVGIRPGGPEWRSNDNFVATVAYSDGSVCTLTYVALGEKSHPKERMEIFADGKVISLDDYRNVTIAGGRHRGWSDSTARKGQKEELEVLAQAIRSGAWPIALEELLRASEIAFEVEAALDRSAQGAA